MGLISDFIVATPDEATRYPARGILARPGGRQMEIFQSGDFTGLEIEMLWALLRGEPWSTKLHSLEHVGESAKEVPWLMRFPTPLVEQLATLLPSAIPPVATAWAKTEELNGSSEDALVEVIRALRALARQAQAHAPTRALYLCVSL